MMNTDELTASWGAWTSFLSVTEGWDILFSPKRHLMTHLVDRSGWFGNPRAYANWMNEGDNRVLKAMCRTVSQNNFECFLLLRMRHYLNNYQRGEKRALEP